MVIFNRYKNIFDNFINNWNAKFWNKLKVIDKMLCNIFRSKNKFKKARLKLEKHFLNKNFLDKLL